MKKFLFFFWNIIIIIFNLDAQKHDYTWLWSGTSPIDFKIKGNFIDFNDRQRKINLEEDIPLLMGQVNASISDKDGNLLFYFNGCTVVGSDHKMIENGDKH